jgi:PIN like domain
VRTNEPPRFFLDRGLNGKSIAAALRDGGFAAVTMDEMYGREDAEKLADDVWIRDATEAGLVLLHKDKRVRYKPIEKDALLTSAARSFALANGNLLGSEMVRWYLNNLDDIVRTIGRRAAGPYFYHVHEAKIVSMRLAP